MSWEAVVPATAGEDFAQAAEDAPVVPSGNPERELTVEEAEQVKAAQAACVSLAASGALGTEPLTASLKGHGNDGHAPHEGAVKDHITISVGQV